MKKTPRKGGRASTPVSFNNHNVPPAKLHSFMEEWSLTQAENNHVETIDEASNFEIFDHEEDFFEGIPNLTVYEMHDQAEENLQLYQNSLPPENDQETEDESNETSVQARDDTDTTHDQSALNATDPPQTPP